jgi:hypothetical protein
MNQVEEAVNELSDNWGWWPFRWLRPEKHVPLSLARIFFVTALYGAPMSLLMLMAAKLAPDTSRSELLFAGSVFPLLFLFLGSVVIAPMWNRRAERLRRKPAARS